MNWFKKKKDSTPTSTGSPDTKASPGSTLGKDIDIPDYSKKRNIDKIVKALFDAMNDTKKEVRDSVRRSLERIGHQEPLLVISKGLKFLVTTSRSNKTHRVYVMDMLTWLMNEIKELEIPLDLANALVRVAAVEMVSEKSISSEWQNSACTLLVASSRVIPNVAAQHLLDRFPSGKIPHYFVIKALADFAHTYPELFIPHLKEAITRTLPLLGMLKHDNLKWVFAAGLGRWAEAVVRCYEEEFNITPNITMADYAQTMHSALNHIAQEWLLSKQVKIRLVSAEGVGYMTKIVEVNHLREQFPKLIPMYTKLMKKESKHQLPVTTGFRLMVEAMMTSAPGDMEAQLDSIISTINTHMIANEKNDKYEYQEANFMEFAKLFEAWAKGTFTDQIVSHVLKQIGDKSNSTRMVYMKLLTHLIMTIPEQMKIHHQEVVTSVGVSPKFDHIPGKHVIAELIRAMGEKNYLKCTGGYDLIQLVLDGCAISDGLIAAIRSKAKGRLAQNQDPEHLRQKCDDIMIEFTTGSYTSQMDEIFWPKLFKELVSQERAAAFVIVAQCIHHIGKRMKEASNFILDFTKEVNIPKPQEMFARLIIMLAKPFERNESGVHILRALYTLSPNIHHKVVPLWASRLRELKKMMDGVDESFSYTTWENSLLNFVRDSLHEVDDDQWNVLIGGALLSQHSFYSHDPKLKQILLSLAGLIIKNTKYQDFVNRGINELFDMTNHSNELERLGAARGLGQASQMHIDTVLTKLTSIVNAKEPKSRGWGSKKKKDGVTVEAKATAVLTYGYICRLVHPDQIKSRIHIHIVTPMMKVVEENSAHVVLTNALTAYKFVGKAIHPNKFRMVDVDPIELKSRNDLVDQVIRVMNREGKSSMAEQDELTLSGLTALVDLIRLQSDLAEKPKKSLISNVLALFKLGKNTEKYSEIEGEIHVVMQTLLEEEFSQGTLDDIFVELSTYMRSKRVQERASSTDLLFLLLKFYAKELSSEKPSTLIKNVLNAEQFYALGRYLGQLVPRVTDDDAIVRQHAVDAIYLILRIGHCIASHDKEVSAEYFEAFGELRGAVREEVSEPNELLEYAKQIAVILSKAVTTTHFFDLMDALIDTLDDVILSSAYGSTRVVLDLMALRCDEFETNCAKYVRKLIVKQESLSDRERVCNGLALSVRNLAKTHHATTIETMLDHPIPHNPSVRRTFATLSRDLEISKKNIDHIVDLLNNGQLNFEKSSKSGTIKVSSPLADSATASIHEMLECPKIIELVSSADEFPRVLMTLLLRVGSIMILEDTNTIEDNIKNIITLLSIVKDGEIHDHLKESSKKPYEMLRTRSTYPQGVQTIMHAVCPHFPDLIGPFFDFIQPFIDRTSFDHYVVATCVVSVLLHYMKNDNTRVQSAINCLLRRSSVVEPSVTKLYAIRGLGTLKQHPEAILQKFLTSVMTNLITCIEDGDERIILETMKVARELFSVAKDEYVSQLIINLTVRLHPAFEKSNPLLRAHSIGTFEVFNRFCRGSQSTTLINTIHTHFPLFVLHLQDPDVGVRDACRATLNSLVPELAHDHKLDVNDCQLVDLFQDLVDRKEDGQEWAEPFAFDLFAKKFAVFFVEAFPNRIAEFTSNMAKFYESSWPELAAGAVRILGYMVAEMSDSQRRSMNLTLVTNGLTKLLFSPNECCREASALVLGLLHEA